MVRTKAINKGKARHSNAGPFPCWILPTCDSGAALRVGDRHDGEGNRGALWPLEWRPAMPGVVLGDMMGIIHRGGDLPRATRFDGLVVESLSR